MASSSRGQSKPPSPEPIPLQDLSRPPDERHHTTLSDSGLSPAIRRSRSLLPVSNFGAELGRRISQRRYRRSYDRVREERLPPGPEVPDLQLPQYDDDRETNGPNVVEFVEGFAQALGDSSEGRRGSWLPPRNLDQPISPWVAADDDSPHGSEVGASGYEDYDDDTACLTNPINVQPMGGSELNSGHRRQQSSQSVRFAPGSSLGDDLHSAEEGMSSGMSKGNGGTRSRSGSMTTGSPHRSGSFSKNHLSPNASPVRRVSVALQNMSQRVVNLSNDPEAVEQALRRRSSSKSHRDGPPRPPIPAIEIHSHDGMGASDSEEKPITPLRRSASQQGDRPWHMQSNPLQGNAMRIFSPTNPLRLFLCDVLIHP